MFYVDACFILQLLSGQIDLIKKTIRLITEHADDRQALLQAHMNEYPGEVNFFLQRFQNVLMNIWTLSMF